MQKLSIVFVVVCIFLISACSTTTNEKVSEIVLDGSLFVKGHGESSVPKLHAILVADTENQGAYWLDIDKKELGMEQDLGMKQDLKSVKRLLRAIEDITIVEVESHILEGKEFSYKKVIDTIDQLTLNQNDVILFYYTGHGTNERGYGFPNLTLGKDKREQPVLDDIISQIKRKNAHFSVILADACNNYSERVTNDNGIKGFDEIRFKIKKENFNKLFLSARGQVVGVAAKDGQFAVGTSDGGKFTNQVLDSLEKEFKSDKPTWDNFEKAVEIAIHNDLEKIGRQIQNPSVEIILGDEEPMPSILAVSVEILPSTYLSLGSRVEINFTNQSDTTGYLVAWDISSRDKVTRVVPYLNEEIKLDPRETKPSSSTVIEPTGRSFLVAILTEDRQTFDVLKGLTPTTRQQLLNQIQQQGLKPTEVEYEIVK